MGRVGVENLPVKQSFAHRLQDDLIDDLLDGAIGKATSTVLAEGRSIRNFVGQAETDDPAIDNIGLNLTNTVGARNGCRVDNRETAS